MKKLTAQELINWRAEKHNASREMAKSGLQKDYQAGLLSWEDGILYIDGLGKEYEVTEREWKKLIR